MLIVYASFYFPKKILIEFEKVAKEKIYDAVFHGMVSWTYGKIVQEPWLLPRASACYYFNKNKIDYNKVSVHNDYPILENSFKKILKTNKDYCIHMFRDDDMEILTKKEINYAIDEAKEKYNKNYKIINSRYILTEVIKAFIIGYIRMGGYKHGVPGVIYHIQHAIQRFLVFQKLWELQNNRNFELNRKESIAKRESLINEKNID